MKTLAALSAALAFTLSGCATTEPQYVAKAECKVAPVTTKSAVGKAGPATELDRKWAQAQLASTGYRREELQRWGYASNLEQALDDCR